MTPLLVGIDVGGTKTHLRAVDTTGVVVVDQVRLTNDWHGASWAGKATQLQQWMTALLSPAHSIEALAVGARGCDTEEQSDQLRQALLAVVDCPVRVVNDAQLLGAAVGHPDAIGLIAGTGSIVVGRRPDGHAVFAGGHGWLLGDDGGAAGLVRQAVRALLRAQDAGTPDPTLIEHLARAAEVQGIEQIAFAMTDRPATHWSSWAPAIFDAASNGSPVAAATIASAARALAGLVGSVIDRGAIDSDVVMAGGVVVAQPAFADQITVNIRHLAGHADVHVLHEPPVAGAIALARDTGRLPATAAKAPASDHTAAAHAARTDDQLEPASPKGSTRS